jgi:hypothetical protein
MFTALDADPARLDKHEQNFVANIRAHGWFATHVLSDGERPGFSYTTGFWLKFAAPEVILFSMRREIAHDTLWQVYHELEAGRRFPAGEPTDAIFQNSSAVFLPVSPRQYRAHLGWSRWFLAMMISHASSWYIRIAADISRGRQGHPMNRGRPNRI